MRTLVISDLHLGNRGRRDVLRQDAVLSLLLAALQDVQRLVLLGDTLEYHGRHGDRALPVAEPILRRIGAAMAGGEIILLPGNHDHDLIRRWLDARGDALGVAETVPSNASAALARVVAALGPATVRVRYPGVWLGDGVYAIHGQYADRHLRPESAVGLRRRSMRGPDYPGAYEQPGRRRPRQGRRSPVGRALAGAHQWARSALLYDLPPLVMRPWMAPVIAAGLDLQMRRSALPALGQVITDLGVDADWVLFGHVHRLGPRAGDDPQAWRIGSGGTRLINTGSWQYEALLSGRGEPPHGYWPGGAVLLEPGCEPRVLGLLDDLSRARLRPGTPSGAGPVPATPGLSAR